MSKIERQKQLVGKRLRDARTGKDLTQTALSEALADEGLFISASAIAKIENGKRGLDVVEASVLAHVLGLRLDVLARGNQDDAEVQGAELQDQSFTNALEVIRDIRACMTGVDSYLDIVVERTLLPPSETYRISQDSAMKADAMSRDTFDSLVSAMESWYRAVVHGGTMKPEFAKLVDPYELTPISERLAERHGSR